MKATYNIKAESLAELLTTCVDISNVMGMDPDTITLDDDRTEVRFDYHDARKVRDGYMDEYTYIEIHTKR